MTTATITITNGITHTGDCAVTLNAAMQVCAEAIMADPEWTAEVIVSALLAQHELNKGIDIKRVKATLREGLSYREFA